jgi:hypothetical protein
MTNSKQQTAMQELIQRLKALHENHFGEVGLEISIEIASQLLEKEKEQIVNTWSQATSLDYEIGLLDASYILCQIHNAEQYYNETYGGNNEEQ